MKVTYLLVKFEIIIRVDKIKATVRRKNDPQ